MALARALRVTDIVDVDTTALWEVNLDKIKHGELSYLDFKKDILKATNKLVDDIKNSTAASISSSSSSFSTEAVGTCPHCGGKIKESKSGFFAKIILMIRVAVNLQCSKITKFLNSRVQTQKSYVKANI